MIARENTEFFCRLLAVWTLTVLSSRRLNSATGQPRSLIIERVMKELYHFLGNEKEEERKKERKKERNRAQPQDLEFTGRLRKGIKQGRVVPKGSNRICQVQ